jgi:putative heme transporter
VSVAIRPALARLWRGASQPEQTQHANGIVAAPTRPVRPGSMRPTATSVTRRVPGHGHQPAARPTGDAAVSPALRTAAGYVWRIALIAAAVYVVFMAFARVQTVAVAVFGGLVLCAILNPVTRMLARWMPRGLAAALTLFIAVIVVIGLFTYIGASAATQSGQLTSQLQDGITRLTHWLNRGPLKVSTTDLNNAVTQAKAWISNNRVALAREAISSAGLALELVSGFALAVFCSLFFLSSGDRMWLWALDQVPGSRRARVDGAVRAGWEAFAGYTRGTLIVAATNATVVATALLILRVPLALPLAVLVFFASFVPLIGAPVAMVVATLVALAGRGPVIALIVLAMIALIGQFEGHVLHPLVMSRAVNLHPVVVALSVVTGALLGGIIGAIIAVPVVSTTWAVMKYLRETEP